ncbi:uncharacterized protein DS421_10g292420 [Arachis hypogaea]|nr:uncharacterized protein DS421_10g292420 [Arachis hypogaea]
MKNYGSSCDGCLLLEGWVLQAAASSELLEFGEEKTVCGGRWGSTWRCACSASVRARSELLGFGEENWRYYKIDDNHALDDSANFCLSHFEFPLLFLHHHPLSHHCLHLHCWFSAAAPLFSASQNLCCRPRSTWIWGSRTSNAIQASTTAMFITLPTEAHSGEPPPPSQPLPLLHSSCSETCRQAEVLQIKLLVVVVAVVGIERRFLREPPRTSGSSPSTPTTPVTPQVTGLAEQPFIMVLIP